MPTRHAHAHWEGTIKEGSGQVTFGGMRLPYSFASRFENGSGTNPEELLGAAHAGCFAMALSLMLTEAGFPPDALDVTAQVSINPHQGGFKITRSHLVCTARVPKIDEAGFRKHAEAAKAGCPVSVALAGTEISLEVTLAG